MYFVAFVLTFYFPRINKNGMTEDQPQNENSVKSHTRKDDDHERCHNGRPF